MTTTNSAVRTQVADPADLGAIIRERRTQSGLTQKDFAGALGVNRRYVYELERGGPDARLQRTLAALELLGVSVRLEVDGQPAQLPARKGRGGRRADAATSAVEAGTAAEAGAPDEGRGERRGWLRRRRPR